MDAADETFVPLHAWLTRATLPTVHDEAPPPEPVAIAEVPPVVADLGELARDVRLFRARLADALEAARDALLRELAVAVIGRELVSAPADLGALAQRLIAAHAHPVSLRVAPSDAGALAGEVPVRADPQLAPGDLVLELADGACDARLGVRLAGVLAAWS